MLNGDPVISEVVARNEDGYLDYYDQDSDWFEVHNRGSSSIDLKGWHFTDDLTNPTKWQVPLSTVLTPDERLLVFASNKDLVTPNHELHTNFRFDGDGEFVGISDPSGQLVNSLTFPALSEDISFGIDESIAFLPLVTTETMTRALVPTSDSLGTTWTGNHEPWDDTTWTVGTAGVGYETGQVGSTFQTPVAYWTFDELLWSGTIAPDAMGRYDGSVSGATLTSGNLGRFGEALSFDGDNDYVLPGVISEISGPESFTISLWFQRSNDNTLHATNHAINNVLIAQSSSIANDNLEIGSASDSVEIYLDTAELGGNISPIVQQAGIQNNVWHHLVVSYDSDATDELKIYVDGTLAGQHDQFGGLVSNSHESPFAIGISRPGTSAWGDFEGLIDDVAVWDTAVDLEQVTALYNGTSPVWLSGYQPLLGLDLESSLYGHNSSAYIRLPFSATQPESFDILNLQMQYDDAFVAYINGTEVARSGVTGPPQFNSTADVDRHDAAALLTDDFFIANAPGLLADGPNILAIQLLNASPTSPRALLRPTLTAIQSLADQSLITKRAAATGFIPVDNSWGTTWTGTSDFDDTSWISGTTAAGYDTGPEGPAGGPVAYWSFDTLTDGGTTAPDSMGHYDGVVSGATLTSGGLGRFGEALSFDGNNDSVMAGVIPELAAPAAFTTSAWFRRTVDRAGSGAETNHYVNNVLFAQSSDGANDNLEIGTEGDFLEIYLDTDQLGGAALPLRQQVPLQNDTWHHLVVTYDRHQANELKLYWDGLLVSQHTEYGGPVTPSETSPFSIGLARPGQNEWGDFEGLIDDVAIWNEALHSSQVTTLFQGTSPLMLSAFDDQIGLDLEAQLAEANSNTSAFVRIPFTVENPDEIVSLNLAMQFDDAFAAYINGSEVARSNVSGSLTWNSAADSDRPDEDALMAENFFIANQPGLLQSGTNILALQALSFDAERLLAFPQLTATMLPSRSFGFMETPTPKEAGTSTLTAIASPVTFSLPSNTFSEDFLLQLTTDEPDGEIRYTTNGDEPSETSTRYTQPLEITESIQIRGKVFRDAHIASETVTETYLRLSTGVQSFNSDLPIIVLDNLGAGNIPTYNPKQPVFMAIFEPDSSGRSSLTNTPEIATRAEFRSRGSSSQLAPKKSYRIETWSEKNDDGNISPFGMPSDSDWILHGPYFYDRALLRNDLIYELSNQIGRYAVRTQFVEVYVNSNGGELTNGDFMGLYSFMENIKRGKDRVDIQRLYPNATSEPEISGGHIVAIDALCWVQCGPSQTEVFFHSSRGLPSNDSYYVHNYPDKETITSAQRNWVENYFEEFEDALYGPNFNDPEIGYASLIDVDSFVDGHWLGQIAKNEDNLVHSTYFHIPRGEKMIMGPTWDYDQSMADSAEKPAEQDRKRPDEWHRFTNFDWWGRLFQDPDFEQKWIDRYQELRKDSFRPENIHSIIDVFADEIREAQQRNIQRWPGVQPQGGNWQIGEIDRLKQWYTDRIAWIDTQFAAQPIYSQPSGQVIVGQQLTITAPSGLVYYTTDGTDPRAPGGGLSPSAILNSGPVTLNESMQLIGRSFAGGQWSGPNEAIFAVGNPVELAITEINYNPADPSAGELLLDSNLDNDDFEFIEIQNIGSKTAKLLNHAFTNGIQFLFPDVQLLPGERGLIVNNRSAFELRYGTGHNVLGEFDNTKLSNAGENLTLVDFTNNPLVDFSYNDNDPWPEAADGIGATLELIDPVNTPLDELGNPFHWRSSTEYGGTPGTSGLGQVGVIINEVLANTDAGMSDAIELLNTGSISVDISGWFLSDSDDDLLKFPIPNRAPLEPGKWVVFDESDFNASAGIAPGDFALNGTFGEDVWLVMADASGNILSFIDEVHFPPSLVHESLGRHPNGSRELIPNQNITLGSANSSPRVGPVVISEVMYNPADPDDGSDPQQLEFVELYNPTSASVDLGNWELNGIGWTFPGGTRIGPGEFFNPGSVQSSV